MSFRHYNPNPDHNRVGDCTVRALSEALGMSWEDTYWLICGEGALQYDMPSGDAVWGAVLKMAGFQKRTIPDTCPACYSVRQFADDHPQGVYVVVVASHVLTVRDGDYYDTWDSGDEVPIYYYFREE